MPVIAWSVKPRDHSHVTTAETYAEFAAREAHGVSPAYERLSLAVSRDAEVLALLDTLPPSKRQPNLLFGVVRLLGGPVDDPAAFHDYTVANWPAIEAEMRVRATQTNEAGRCAVLLPVLAALPQPLALLEVGASAGLCLYPDRYAYRYGDHVVGSGEPVLECAATGMAPPARVPEVVWRAGLDLNPLDVTDPADVAWLDALIWPEHAHRRARLRAAAAVAAADPPLLVRGDLVDDLPALAAQAPADATLVVFHTSVLYQVSAPRREAFADLVRGLPGHWIANEAPDVLRYEHAAGSHRATRCTTCSRSTGDRWPGPADTGRRSSGSPRSDRAPSTFDCHPARRRGYVTGTIRVGTESWGWRMGERDDFLGWVGTRLTDAETALHNGDAGPRLAIWSSTEPVTLFGAWISGRGYEEVAGIFRQLESTFSDCLSYSHEIVAADVNGDMAYTVGYEHTRASVEGESRQYSLRVTQVYRREGGEWKVVHRHADTVPEGTADQR